MNNELEDVKKQLDLAQKALKHLGQRIEVLEEDLKREPEGFLGLGDNEIIYALECINGTREGFLDICKGYTDIARASRGYLNVYKTKEQAEAARYVLIGVLAEIKLNLENGDYAMLNVVDHYEEGKRIAKELGLE